MTSSSLPFVVRPVVTAEDLARVVALRAEAYGRRRPELGRALAEVEPDDRADDCVVLAAFAKGDGAVHGTIRIHDSRARPLPLEGSVTLPAALVRRRRAEATRLARAAVASPVVKLALFKAYYQFCLARGIEAMLAAGRAPLDRQYEALLFEDVFPGAGYLPMRHAGGLPHRVLVLDVASARARWTAAGHPLLAFMVEHDHPEIALALAPPGASAPSAAPPPHSR